MIQAVRQLIKRISSNPPAYSVAEEASGVRALPSGVGEGIHIRDNEIKVVYCATESDIMVKLSTMCPFLSHKDYQVEVSDYLFAHFCEVFTFHPITGKATHHTR